MLARNSPDCSSFFFFLMAELWALPRSTSLPPAPSAAYPPSSSVLFIMFWHILHLEALLKSALWQPATAGLLLHVQAEKVFLKLHHPAVGLKDSPTLWCQWTGEKMRKREVCWCQRLSVSWCGIWCHAWRWGLPRWQNPCFRLKGWRKLIWLLFCEGVALDGL